MSNVYDGGQGDARLLNAAEIPDDCKLFRKRYRQLTPDEVMLHDAIKERAEELAVLIASINNPPSQTSVVKVGTREALLAVIANNNGAHITLALRHLEDCVYRAVKALTA